MFIRLLVLQNVAVSKFQYGSQNFCSKPTITEPDKVFHAYTSTSNPTRSRSERKLFHNFVLLCTIAYNYISHIKFIILYKNGHIYTAIIIQIYNLYIFNIIQDFLFRNRVTQNSTCKSPNLTKTDPNPKYLKSVWPATKINSVNSTWPKPRVVFGTNQVTHSIQVSSCQLLLMVSQISNSPLQC